MVTLSIIFSIGVFIALMLLLRYYVGDKFKGKK